MTRDGALGLLLLALAGSYYAAADAIPPSSLADAVGPGGLPKAYAVVLGALALVLLARAWRGAEAGGPAVSGSQLLRVAGLLGIGVLYLVVVPWVGYPVAVAGLLIGVAWYQGGRLDRRVAAVGIGGAAVLWLVFAQLLGIQYPLGVWLERLLGTS